MSWLLLVLFFGMTAGMVLLLSSFPYKKQSFLLGVSGGVSGGLLALVLRTGMTVEVAETLWLLFFVESVLLFFLQRSWQFR